MTHEIEVEQVIERAKTLIESYAGFVKHAPKMLRQSMMLAYQTAVDDMLKALDASRANNAVKHTDDKRVVLLDQNGHAG